MKLPKGVHLDRKRTGDKYCAGTCLQSTKSNISLGRYDKVEDAVHAHKLARGVIAKKTMARKDQVVAPVNEWRISRGWKALRVFLKRS